MTDAHPHITIALCTLNGAAHLHEQLNSYLKQTDVNWRLWVSDDGSSDATLQILNDFSAQHGRDHEVRIVEGPKKGVAANFLSLLCHPEFPTGPVAISDQDDVWLEHKLARAYQQMQGPGPVIYGAQSLHVDAELRPIGRSGTANSRPSFKNALVQNVISGHSCVLSAEALMLVRSAGVPQGVPYHDWWLYLLITAAGGRALVDNNAVLLYRQHGDNLMGAHSGMRARLARARQVLASEYGGWVASNTNALVSCSKLLTAEARQLLQDFRHPKRGLGRVSQLRRLDVTRQGQLGTASLYLAAALGKV